MLYDLEQSVGVRLTRYNKSPAGLTIIEQRDKIPVDLTKVLEQCVRFDVLRQNSRRSHDPPDRYSVRFEPIC